MTQVLFICLGNICRSPAAETIFRDKVIAGGLGDHFTVDSCGTSSLHEGEEADLRMKKHAQDRGYKITSRSRGFRGLPDFENFDYIVTMDDKNHGDILDWPNVPEPMKSKVYKFATFCEGNQTTEVKDPYYGGPKDFEETLDLLEKGCDNLLRYILCQKDPDFLISR